MSHPVPGRPDVAQPFQRQGSFPPPRSPVSGIMVPASAALRAKPAYPGKAPAALRASSEIITQQPFVPCARPEQPSLSSPRPYVGLLPKPLAGTVPANLEELLQRLAGATSLPLRKHRDTMAAVRAVGRVLGRPLRDITTAPAQLRPLLANAHPAMAEMSPARWTAVRSLLLGALFELGINVMPSRATRRLSPAWQALFDGLAHDRKCRCRLSRIVHAFSDAGVQPEDVDADALTRYRQLLVDTSLRGNPETSFKQVIYYWKRAVLLVPGWPATGLTLVSPDCTRRYALTLDAFPASFRADVEAFLNHSAVQDPFAEDYAPPVRASTNMQRRRQILQLASALVASGAATIDQVTSLAVLVETEKAKAALRHLLDRRQGAKGTGLGQQAQLLRTIGRHWVKTDEATIRRLRDFAANLTPQQLGMVAKNRDRLRQFDLQANVTKLLRLPQTVLDKVAKSPDPTSHANALRVMYALAVEILTAAPMRVRNLCELDLERDLVETRRKKARHRRISIARTKTEVSFEWEIRDRTGAMLDLYVATYRPRVCAVSGHLLFPGRGGKPRAVTQFSTAISAFIYRESGLVMNPHLFRHLMVKLHAAHCPDDTETPRLALGHTTSNTIQRSYAERRTDNAFKRWDATLAMLRDKPTGMPLPALPGQRSRRSVP